jgi:hypothetical protein
MEGLAAKAKNIADEANNNCEAQHYNTVKQYHQYKILKAAEQGRYNYKMTSMIFREDGTGAIIYHDMDRIIAWLKEQGFKVEYIGYDEWRVEWE